MFGACFFSVDRERVGWSSCVLFVNLMRFSLCSVFNFNSSKILLQTVFYTVSRMHSEWAVFFSPQFNTVLSMKKYKFMQNWIFQKKWHSKFPVRIQTLRIQEKSKWHSRWFRMTELYSMWKIWWRNQYYVSQQQPPLVIDLYDIHHSGIPRCTCIIVNLTEYRYR